MERIGDVALFCLALFFLSTSVAGLLSPKGVNYEGDFPYFIEHISVRSISCPNKFLSYMQFKL